MKRAVFAVPGSLDTPTGGYAYDKRIIHELRALGWQIDVVDLGDGFPFPDDDARQKAAHALAQIEKESVVIIDGLAYGVLADEGARLSKTCRIVALVHHPLALEAGLTPEQVNKLKVSEAAALRRASAVIVTSEPTKEILEKQYEVELQRIKVVLPGVDRPALVNRDKMTRDDVHILSVGSLIERKGYDLLIEALADLREFPWRLVIAGDMTRDARVTEKLKADIERFGIGDRIALVGAVATERLHELYAEADMFALASRFEGYGMVYGEAIAAGLPVVVTDVGLAKDVAGRAGLIVPPDDVPSLKEALRRMINSHETRSTMAEAAMIEAKRLPPWDKSGAQFADILERMI